MVKKRGETYKCLVCGNIVEVNHVGGGELVCCGQPMSLLVENIEEAAQEKHIPVVTKIDNSIKVVVGEINHPMEQGHYIEWIELIVGDRSYKQYLKPEEKPEAIFSVNITGGAIVREYCSLHGLWKADV